MFGAPGTGRGLRLGAPGPKIWPRPIPNYRPPKQFQINLNLCSLGLGRIIPQLEAVF